MHTCEQSAEYLAGVTTTFTRFRVVVGNDSVVVDSEAEYTDRAGDASIVASSEPQTSARTDAPLSMASSYERTSPDTTCAKRSTFSNTSSGMDTAVFIP